MKLSVIIFSVLAFGLNIQEIVSQSSNINNLIISELQSLLSQTQQNIRGYLSSILVDAVIRDAMNINVDAVFASTSSNLTNVVNKGYSCSKLTTTTTSTSNCRILSFKINLIFYWKQLQRLQ